MTEYVQQLWKRRINQTDHLTDIRIIDLLMCLYVQHFTEAHSTLPSTILSSNQYSSWCKNSSTCYHA